MQDIRLSILFKKYFDKSATQQEREELFALVRESANKENIEMEMEMHWKNFNALDNPFSEQDKSAMLEHILRFNEEQITLSDKHVKRHTLLPRWVAAASIAIAVMVGSYFYYNNQKPSSTAEAYTSDIAPGKNGATLMLANGQKIFINDALTGNIAEQSGVKISKTKDGQIVYDIIDNGSTKLEYNTLSTTRGEQTQVRLPDGSIVFLNAMSSLKYPTRFSGLEKRNVSLTGEAYFEIAKDKSHPFIVVTDNQEVEVLGTHFNINSYADEPSTKTTLSEGSVKVSLRSSKSGDKFTVLKPNQQALLTAGEFKLASVNADDIIAWKNGLFVLEDESLQSIMKRVERWYNVEVSYADGINKNMLYFGSVSRYDKVSKILETIESAGGIHFKIEGRRILVMK